jgi:hypothetical protein
MRLVKIGIAFSLLIILAKFLPSNSQELGVFVVQPSTTILRFQELGHGCGGPNGSWITGYISHTGKRLSLSSARFQSRIEANQELQKRLQGGARIEETGPKYNQHGKVTGERIVAVFVAEDRITAAILWTQNESIFAIETESMECALEFERYRPTLD